MPVIKQDDEKSIDDKTRAFEFLPSLLENGSQEDKNEVRAYLG